MASGSRCADVVGGDADALADALAELVLGHEQVPDHPLLDRPVALDERVDEVGDEVVALPRLGEQVALAGLLVVVACAGSARASAGPRSPGPAPSCAGFGASLRPPVIDGS